MESSEGATLLGAVSFEERSIGGPTMYLERGGDPAEAFLLDVVDSRESVEKRIDELEKMGFSSRTLISRLQSRALWDWTWQAVQSSSKHVLIDATCFNREILGMLLFAISVRRHEFERIEILYTAPELYVTQCKHLSEEEKWLSRGVHTIRSIIGFPGDFSSRRNRHVVAMGGHELERLLEIITYLEPKRLSISNEAEASSTVIGADEISARLREKVGCPEDDEVIFYADSIDKTFDSLCAKLRSNEGENITVVAMNTKLSFIGAALCALHLRHLRMVYAVPIEYNPNYSRGRQGTKAFDITELIKSVTAIPAH